MGAIRLAYYGYLFDASGYGQAARAHVHALHRAGVELSVVDLQGHAPQVPDTLVESLLRRRLDPDLHLFHGIPPQWARRAFALPNAIGNALRPSRSACPTTPFPNHRGGRFTGSHARWRPHHLQPGGGTSRKT